MKRDNPALFSKVTKKGTDATELTEDWLKLDGCWTCLVYKDNSGSTSYHGVSLPYRIPSPTRVHLDT